MNTTQITLLICLLISLISCKRTDLTETDCQSSDDLAQIAQSFDTCKYANTDFLISFKSEPSQTEYATNIEIFKQNHEYKLESFFVLRKFHSSKSDTSYFKTILPKEKVDSLVQKINQLGCHSYRIGNVLQSHGNSKKVTYKNKDLIKGWMWQDGILSATNSGERFVDSMLVKAFALEGMLYRYAGAGEPKVGYTFYPACENDSTIVAIYSTWGDFITLSVTANHPKYKFEPLYGYTECKMNCRDTVSLAKDLEIIVTTKESKTISIEPTQIVSDR